MKKKEIKLELEMVYICPSCHNGCEGSDLEDLSCDSCGYQFPKYKMVNSICKDCNRGEQRKIPFEESDVQQYHTCLSCFSLKRQKEKQEEQRRKAEEFSRHALRNFKPKPIPRKKKQKSDPVYNRPINYELPTTYSGVEICSSCEKRIDYSSGFARCGCS